MLMTETSYMCINIRDDLIWAVVTAPFQRSGWTLKSVRKKFVRNCSGDIFEWFKT